MALLATALLVLAGVGIYLWKPFGSMPPAQARAAITEAAEEQSRNPVVPATPVVAGARHAVPLWSPAAEESAEVPASAPASVGEPSTTAAADLFLKPTIAESTAPAGRTLLVPPTPPAIAPEAAAATPQADPPAGANEEPASPAPPDDAAKFHVTSIAVSPQSSTAVINGHIVTVGDTVDGARVVAITARTVELIVAGRRATLNL